MDLPISRKPQPPTTAPQFKEETGRTVLPGAFLHPDVMKVIAELTDVQTALNIAKAAEDLRSIADSTDLKKLEEFCKTHPDFKTEWSLRILLLLASGGPYSSAEELIAGITKVSGNLSPEEAFKQLSENLNVLRTAVDGLKNSVQNLGPYIIPSLMTLGGALISSSLGLMYISMGRFAQVMFVTEPGLAGSFASLALVSSVLISCGARDLYSEGWAPLAMMRATAQNALESIERNLKR